MLYYGISLGVYLFKSCFYIMFHIKILKNLKSKIQHNIFDYRGHISSTYLVSVILKKRPKHEFTQSSDKPVSVRQC